MNTEQLTLCERIYEAVHSSSDAEIRKMFILNSPGGFGKTFVLKAIAARIRAEGGIVICVASTGLAAQNLEGGRTAHVEATAFGWPNNWLFGGKVKQ